MKNWVELINEKLQGWWVSLIKLLPNLVLALLVIILAILIGRFVRRNLYRLLSRISAKASFNSLFATITQIVVLLIGLFIALDILQLNKAVSSLLAGAGIIGIILGFAFQDITSNFIAGIYIAFKKPFDIGHTIKTNDFIGNVEEIQLRSTTIRTFSGLHLMIPNRDLIQKPLINYSLTPERRIELDFFIDYTSDLEITHKSVFNAIAKIAYLYPGKPVEIYFNDVKYTAIKISVWFWIDNHSPPGYMVARHDAIFNVVTALKENKISLVLPLAVENLAASPN
ncbi:MAG: mechanosensitive ion channel family protein [Chitinophagaceae bacterium]